MKLQEIKRTDEDYIYGYMHWCPGCRGDHLITTHHKNKHNAIWTFDGNMQKPTFTPSIKILQSDLKTAICHYFIREGKIEYCNDCIHNLAGQIIILPDIPNE